MQVRESETLKRVMRQVLELGNIINQGTARGGAKAFKLDSLSKLGDVRAVNNKMTLMHYLGKVCREFLPMSLTSGWFSPLDHGGYRHSTQSKVGKFVHEVYCRLKLVPLEFSEIVPLSQGANSRTKVGWRLFQVLTWPPSRLCLTCERSGLTRVS